MAYRHLLCTVLVWGLVRGTTIGEDSALIQGTCAQCLHPISCPSNTNSAPSYTRSLQCRQKEAELLLPPPQLSDQQPMTRKTMKYKFHVDEVFKGDILPDSEINVDVHEYMAGCSSSFSINQTYLVTGELDAHGIVHNGVCDWSGCWNTDVSLYQKISLKNGGYSCDVKICLQDAECPENIDTCVWPRGAMGLCYVKNAKCHMSARFKKAIWAMFPSSMDRCLRDIPVAQYHE